MKAIWNYLYLLLEIYSLTMITRSIFVENFDLCPFYPIICYLVY